MGHSRKRGLWVVGLATAVVALLLMAVGGAEAQDDTPSDEAYTAFDSLMNSIDWVVGPDSAVIKDIASIYVSDSLLFTGEEGSQALMEAFENPVSGDEYGFVCAPDFSWWALLEWDPAGYVKDDEKSDLDADAMMEALREGNKEGNKERSRRGWATLELIGWAKPPHYDEITHNLEWATVIQSSTGGRSVNHNSRVLGRRGIMVVTLVTDADSLDAYLPAFRQAMAGFAFLPGERYAEYREGDKLSQYGLTALVVGGGAAVAAKTGLFKWIWKLLLLGAAGVASFFKKIFGKKKGPLPPATPGT